MSLKICVWFFTLVMVLKVFRHGLLAWVCWRKNRFCSWCCNDGFDFGFEGLRVGWWYGCLWWLALGVFWRGLPAWVCWSKNLWVDGCRGFCSWCCSGVFDFGFEGLSVDWWYGWRSKREIWEEKRKRSERGGGVRLAWERETERREIMASKKKVI